MEWLRKQLKESDSLFDGSLIALGIGIGIFFGILYNAYFTPVVETAHAEIVEEVAPVEVLVEVVYTKEDIERKIRETFYEQPDIAVRIAKCESGLVADIQSHHMLNGERERSYGIFQIFSPVWHSTAIKLNLEDYRTSVEDNIKLARYIYEQAGKSFRDWSCYSKGMI